jgi:hypothetical protein
MESVQPEESAGSEADASSYVASTAAAVGKVIYPEDTVEGSPAWHAAQAASSAALQAKMTAASLDEKYKISEAMETQKKAAADRMAALDAEHKISEKTAYAYEQTKAGTMAAMQMTQAQLQALDQQHDLSGKAQSAMNSATQQAAALDEQYKVSETARQYDEKYGVSKTATAAASTAASAAFSALTSAHSWWTGKPSNNATVSETTELPYGEEAAAEEAAADGENPVEPLYRARAESEGMPL